MAAYAAGDGACFELLYERHGGTLFTFLQHQTGARAAAEDLFQDVFLRLVRARNRYRPEGSFRAWLFTIAHNALTDHRRRGGVREAAPGWEDGSEARAEATSQTLESGLEPPMATRPEVDTASDPLRGVHDRELGERIELALEHLPAEQCDVFLLRERAGLDFARIAEVTGAALPTVKSRIRYALQGLRRRLADDLAPYTGSRSRAGETHE